MNELFKWWLLGARQLLSIYEKEETKDMLLQELAKTQIIDINNSPKKKEMNEQQKECYKLLEETAKGLKKWNLENLKER